MGFNRSLFLLTIACFFYSGPINASPLPLPARRAFEINADNVNGLTDLRLQDVDATIKEVEGLLKSDPSLPRLTRGEILDIIENLTRSDVQKGVARDPKAIMVVLPYSADSVRNGDVQTLYTKPPMTHLVDEGSDEEKLVSKSEIPQKKRRPSKKPIQPNYENNQGVKIAKVPSLGDSVNESSKVVDVSERFQQQQSATTEKMRSTTENPFTRIINKRRKTTKLPGNHKQEFQEVFTTTTTTVAPKTATTKKVTRKPTLTTFKTTTTKSPGLVPKQGINVIDPPSYQHVPPKTTNTTPYPSSSYIPSHAVAPQSSIESISQRPIMVGDVQIPDDFKDVLKSLDILIKQSPTERAPTVDVQNTPTDQLSEEDKLKLLFASLGGSFTTTTSTTAEPDVMQIANNLTPEMKDLLMTFGLLPDPNKDKTTTPKVEMFMEPSSIINPDSYSSFKPLPAPSNNNPNEEMENFLAKFGLVDKNKSGVSSNREQKAISMSKPQNDLKPSIPNMDVIPDRFKDIIADIGFPVQINPEKPLRDSQIKHNTEKQKQTDKELLNRKPEHVVDAIESSTEFATEDEIHRLNQLMNVIKQFEKLNGTASAEDLKHIDLEGFKDLVNSFNVPLNQQKGPNPLDYDVPLQKNEVKRQTSTTEKSAGPINPSLALLEESFGGSATSSEPVQIETTTTQAPQKTGFYYLLDWNSFFDIDNQKGRRVNLRFQPKAGDPKRFFSVNIP